MKVVESKSSSCYLDSWTEWKFKYFWVVVCKMLIGAFLPGVSCAISVNIIPLCIFQSDHQTDLYICIYRYKFISIHFWQINKSEITCISDFSFRVIWLSHYEYYYPSATKGINIKLFPNKKAYVTLALVLYEKNVNYLQIPFFVNFWRSKNPGKILCFVKVSFPAVISMHQHPEICLSLQVSSLAFCAVLYEWLSLG